MRRRRSKIRYPSEAEIYLRRLKVEDALIKLDRYLNKAFLDGLSSVRVVHGKGTGTLRQAVQAELAKHPLVESFRTAEFWEGGTGVTIVKLVER